jgi:hypothetical protein
LALASWSNPRYIPGVATNLTPKAKACSRCKGTGQARYNHLNGDTYCYLCNGTGVQVVLPKALRERQAADDQWVCDAHYALVGGMRSYENQLRRPVRQATCKAGEYSNDATRGLRRQLTFWVGEGLAAMQAATYTERAAAEAAARAAYTPATTKQEDE